MGLVSRVYSANKQSEEWFNERWAKFVFFNPSLRQLNHKATQAAIAQGDRQHFVDALRFEFFPGEPNDYIEEEYRKAMNRGIQTLNSLCKEYLGADAGYFLAEEIPGPLDLFDFRKKAREAWINSSRQVHRTLEEFERQGRLPGHKLETDQSLVLSAYEMSRAWELGKRILMIEESPEIIDSVRNYFSILKWFREILAIGEPVKIVDEYFSHAWPTKIGVLLYGSQTKPIGSRLKIIGPIDEGLKYDSILLKMFLKNVFPNQINDYTGVELITETDQEREELLKYLGAKAKSSETLERFKDTRKKRYNEKTSPGFDCIKFILRPPVPIEELPVWPERKQHYLKVSVETQLLTLEGHRIRQTDQDVSHREYKRREFNEVFPLWFPRQIYEPLLKGVK